MNSTSIKKIISYGLVIGLFIVVGTISWRMYFREYRQKDTVNIHIFPKKIGPWTAKEIPISEKDYAILETHNAFTRRYTNTAGESVYLFIVYSQNNRKVSHPPELCYTGSGASVLGKSDVRTDIQPKSSSTKSLNVKKVLIEQNGIRQVLYYWFKVGDGFTSNYWTQQALIAIKTFTRQPASSALIRVSMTIPPDGTEKDTEEVLRRFIAAIMPSIQQYLP